MNTRTFTYQTRIEVDEHLDACLSSCAALMSKVEHKLFAEICRGKDPNKLKSAYLLAYGITARQFNAINIYLKGKISSIQSLMKLHATELKGRIKKTQNCIKSLKRRKSKTKHQWNKLHQKQRQIASSDQKLSLLEDDIKHRRVRLCFGSKRLFNKQFHLEENGYTSHEAWKKDWILSRSSQFSLVGSKDENSGNQSCIATLEADNALTLKLKIPSALHQRYGKFLSIGNVSFSYGFDNILAAIDENKERNHLSKKAQVAVHGQKYKEYGQAISYRFLKDAKGWIVFVTIERKAPKIITNKNLGAIGIDINQHHLAVTEIDRTGNPVKAFNIPLVTYGKTTNQTKALVGDACKQLIDFAVKTNKPLVIEDLDFQQKKSELEKNKPKYARMLSSLAYQTIIQTIQSRAFRFGCQVFTVNPAYTSIIGRIKFAKRYGLTIHHAAATVIARRIMNFSESLPRSLENIPDGHGGHLTLHGLVKNRGRHVWSTWAKVLKMFKAAHVAQCQIVRRRRTSPFALTGTPSDEFAEDIPF